MYPNNTEKWGHHYASFVAMLYSLHSITNMQENSVATEILEENLRNSLLWIQVTSENTGKEYDN